MQKQGSKSSERPPITTPLLANEQSQQGDPKFICPQFKGNASFHLEIRAQKATECLNNRDIEGALDILYAMKKGIVNDEYYEQNLYLVKNSLGAVLIKDKQYKDAIQELNEAIEIGKTIEMRDVYPYWLLGNANKSLAFRASREKKDQYLSAAHDAYYTAIKLSPEDLPSWAGLLDILLKQNRTQDAVECKDLLYKIASEDDMHAEILCSLAQIEIRREHHKEAMRLLDLSLKRDPGYVESLIQKSYLFSNARLPHEALKCINKAVKRKPDYGKAWLAKARIHENLGEYGDAIDSAARAVKVCPEMRVAHNLLHDLIFAHPGSAYHIDESLLTKA